MTARAASAVTMVVPAPTRSTTRPLAKPNSASGSRRTAKTTPIFVAEPVVARTNQGNATVVMFEPVDDVIAAVSSAWNRRSRSTPYSPGQGKA